MEYAELIARALKGRSVNSMAKQWGIPQPTLDSYVKGKSMPDFWTAWKIAQEADVEPAIAFRTLALAEQDRKVRNFKLQGGFVQIHMLALLATCGLYGIFYIMSNEEGSETLYFMVLILPSRSHHAAYVGQMNGT